MPEGYKPETSLTAPKPPQGGSGIAPGGETPPAAQYTEGSMTKFSEVCPVCATEGNVSVHRAPFSATYNQVPVELPAVERYRCSHCSEEFFDDAQGRELSRRVKEAARERLKVLAPAQIVAIRKKLDLSQEEPAAANNSVPLLKALTELLRLYDWRNQLGRDVEEGRATVESQKQDLIRYGREKKAAWDCARKAIAAANRPGDAG
jgi:YgiT-type zinc finger domain-containing protein